MITEILTGLAKANLAAGVAVLPVLAMRTLVRPRFGAGASYLLWLAPLAAGLAVLAPHPAVRTVMAPMLETVTASVSDAVTAAPAAFSAGPNWAAIAFSLWVAGVAAAAALLVRRQAAFLAAMGRLELLPTGVFRALSPDVGPAVVGVFRPRIVAPSDFETRFGAQERELILAHEGVHLRRGDAAVNALACLVRCLCWFNPLVHLAARLLRIDQELACDATVIGRFPAQRRTYAELLLKTQLATQPLPLGCHWPAGAEHPLKERIAMLKSPLPERAMRGLGVVVVAGMTLGAGAMAWAAQPGDAAGPGAAERAEALKQLAAHPEYTCDPALEAKGVGCKIISQSNWIAVPTPADIARAYPPGAREAGQTARVSVNCKTTLRGLLKDCAVVDVSLQVPAGEGVTQVRQDAFGDAALKLTRLYQARPPNPVLGPVREGMMTFRIVFGDFRAPRGYEQSVTTGARGGVSGGLRQESATTRTPVRYAPESYAPPAGFAEPRTNAQSPPAAPFHSIWLKKPTGDDMMRLFPADAVAKGLTGEVLMACKVGADGRLNACDIRRVSVSGTVVPDPAADPGFGPATLELSKLFQMEPVSASGASTAGKEIRIPVRFVLPRPPAAVAPGGGAQRK